MSSLAKPVSFGLAPLAVMAIASMLQGCASAPRAPEPAGDWVPVNREVSRPEQPQNRPQASQSRQPVAHAEERPLTPQAAVLTLTRAIAPRAVGFELRQTDLELATSVQRWARASGYELRWELDEAVPVVADARIDAKDLPQALEQLMQALRLGGRQLKAQVFADRVVRVYELAPASATSARFDLLPEDQVVANSLSRWAAREGWDVQWESPVQAPIEAKAGVQIVQASDFRSALARTVESLQQLGYPIRALVYSDRVVRIVTKENS